MKCRLCLKKDANIPICPLCFNEKVVDSLRLNQPDYYKESIMDLFESTIKPQLDHIEKELEIIKTELRIKKIKKLRK